MDALVLDGKTYYLDQKCDAADLHYINSAAEIADQRKNGLITDREMLEQLLILHVEWCNT